ncbi:hypothetical protein AURANDRAFT_63922 [Aureococcus anophagefferens]|uniref:Phospholipid/glycerol acyltransferase domain-containing protein n=1 Tax=Aureococcus anophagefferens TaxID=44056 RepID=F0Y895_AURAN|nr:hypothetical protein AURANDRAFT_63922 [Aureococcus anophagefferens]EGB08751.1 hypothetical protein AURANDRAFT_63922 [Aureococcus anophagefferens]|mmetsp:Transcript_17186/g.55862  ORF Transcript_17186/g.55862 Transcript_17186/m.55862 type:complete len:286 (-) Transcript_17186:6-863(-)|eukprot:XP_009036736.1 hypothetical protein AURANDRAFT_63922 [Aureococcus anophagefferens]
MPKGGGQLTRGNYAFALAAVPVGLALFSSCKAFHLASFGNRRRGERWSLYACRLLLRTLLRCSFWLTIEDEPSEADWDALIPDESCVVIINHASQFDGFFFGAMASRNVMARAKSLMIAKAFKMPLAGTIFKCLGHQPVHFLRDEAGKFSVDKEKQAPVNAKIRAHVAAGGGVLTFCPEGQINRKDPTKCMAHRRGSFQLAIDLKLPVYGFTAFGTHDFWPHDCALPGKRATVVCGLYAVDEWNAKLADGTAGAVTTADLALMSQAAMQKSLDAVAAKHAKLAAA